MGGLGGLGGLGGSGGVFRDTTFYSVLDSFTDTDATAIASHSPSIGGAWTSVTGAATIESNKLSDNGADIQATVSSGLADCTIEVNLTANNDDFQGILFRKVDASNYYIVGLDNDNNVRVWRQIAGVWSNTNSSALTINSGTVYALKAVLSGNTLTFSVDGTVIFDAISVPSFTWATIHGVYTDGITWDGDVLFDDFKISRSDSSDLRVQLDSALIWLKADSLTGADGSAVTTWANEGTGQDFTQATAGNKPTLQTAELNGLSVVRFDGTDDVLLSAAAMSADQPCTFYCVAKRTGNLAAYNVILTQDPEVIAAGYANSANVWYVYTGTALTTQAATDSAFHYLTGTYNVAASIMRADGTAATVTLDDSEVTADTWAVGATNAAAAPLAGDIAEILLFTVLHTASQIAVVQNYLKTKWGL